MRPCREFRRPRRAAAMNPNKALWEKGDFTRIAATMRRSGDHLVDRLGVTEGMKVLDLGCGDGTTAIPAARRGAEVCGVDIAANLVAAGKRRASEEGLTNLTFAEGDAQQLDDLGDDAFDLVVSIFGAMFAPRPLDVAKEMVRVTRPGGRIVMGNWIPGDPTLVAQILRISASYSPPPPEGFVSPMTWGIEGEVTDRFVAAGIAGGQHLVRPRLVCLPCLDVAVGVPRHVQELLRPDDECVRCRRGHWSRRRAPQGARLALQRAEPELR